MERIWTKNYESGVPLEIDPSKYSSVVDILEESFSKFRDKKSFHCMGTDLTYEELDLKSQRFASYLQNDLNLKKGDRVALMMPNILQYPIALFGILRAGCTAVNVNPLYTARELKHQLNDSGAETIIIFENSAHCLEKIIDETPIRHVLTTSIGDLLDFPKNYIVNFVIKHVKKMVPSWSITTAKSFKQVLDSSDESKFNRVNLEHKDIAFLQYTGGTTGVSKGAILSHRNIVSNILQASSWISNLIKEGEDIIITPLPLYHIFSMTANCFTFSSFGALNVLITNPRDIPGFVKELKKWKFTAFTGVNTLFNGLLNNEDFKDCDFSKLKLSLGGGMAVQGSIARKWKEVTGKALIEAYGLTETSPAACMNPLNLKGFNGYIGLPISSTDLQIRNESDEEVALGEIGEICIKGPQVMEGYWNRPEETKKAVSDDGFLRTGDMGHLNEDGYVKLVDRKKDMILVSGFNVYPNEIEDVVCEHPKVLECAAIGVEDEKSGELVKVFVVKKDDSLTEEELKAYCKENFTAYKVPKFYEFKNELPKTNVGKILRRDLRDSA